MPSARFSSQFLEWDVRHERAGRHLSQVDYLGLCLFFAGPAKIEKEKRSLTNMWSVQSQQTSTLTRPVKRDNLPNSERNGSANDKSPKQDKCLKKNPFSFFSCSNWQMMRCTCDAMHKANKLTGRSCCGCDARIVEHEDLWWGPCFFFRHPSFFLLSFLPSFFLSFRVFSFLCVSFLSFPFLSWCLSFFSLNGVWLCTCLHLCTLCTQNLLGISSVEHVQPSLSFAGAYHRNRCDTQPHPLLHQLLLLPESHKPCVYGQSHACEGHLAAKDLSKKLCNKGRKPNVTLIITHDFMIGSCCVSGDTFSCWS